MTMGRVARLAAAVILLLAPLDASAEMRRVQLSVLGMDCAICAHSLVIAARKVEGVESVEVSLERASMDIRLRPGNRITLGQLRQLVKNTGFAAKDATVTALGTLVDRSGKPALDVAGINTVWLLVGDSKRAESLSDAIRGLPSKEAGTVEVTGVVRAPTSASQQEQMVVTAIAPPAK
jgi:copper chaperone CopZ